MTTRSTFLSVAASVIFRSNSPQIREDGNTLNKPSSPPHSCRSGLDRQNKRQAKHNASHSASSQAEEGPGVDSIMTICENCRKTIDSKAKLCPYCRSDTPYSSRSTRFRQGPLSWVFFSISLSIFSLVDR